MKKGFQKRVEDFVCEHCGIRVEGDGYTNHCPKCLWSKHVDVAPGDRAARCGGMMQPTRLEGASPNYVLVHRCTVCKTERRNRSSENDDAEALIRITGRAGI